MAEQLYPRDVPPRFSGLIYKPEKRRWKVEYDLVYDGGSSSWEKHYRTKWGARISAFLHYHIRSWGGSAVLIDKENQS